MLKRLFYATLIAGSLQITLAHAAAEDAAFTHAKHTLASAVIHGKLEELNKARAEFSRLLAADHSSTRLSYWVALSDWRIVPMVPDTAGGRAKKLCVEGIAACDRVLVENPRDAGTLALKAALQGMSLTYFPNLMMSLGPEMAVAYGTAEGIAPNDPRVIFLHALSTLYTPAQYGGGPEKAKPQFERSIALFEKAKPDSTGIDWGHDDALLWSGRCLSRLNDWNGAKSRFTQVIARSPEHAWVRDVLLPEAAKHVADVGAK